MAVLHIGREAQAPTRKCCGMRKWAILFILATLLLVLLTALVFLYFTLLAGVVVTASATNPPMVAFLPIFIAFIVIGVLSAVLTYAAIILNKQPLAVSVFVAAVIHILLAIPLIVFTILYLTAKFQNNQIAVFVIFFLCLVVAAALAIIALLTFLEMRKSRSMTVVQHAQPTVAFVTTVNRSPANRSPAITSRSYQSRTHVSMASSSSSARYLS